MRILSEPITEAFRKLKADNPQLRLALLPVGIWVQMSDFKWQAVIQKGDDQVYRILEKDDPKLTVSQADFVQLFLPTAIELSWQAATNN